MPSPFIVINTKEHATHGWKRYDSYGFAQKNSTVPLLIAEIAAAMQHFPLAFQKNSTGAFTLVALQGLEKDKNLFLNDAGKWVGSYVPSAYRAYPFFFRTMTDGVKSHEVLCLDNNENLYREDPDAQKNEARFFDDEGKPAKLMSELLMFLQQSNENRKLTHAAVNDLKKYDLFEPWEIKGEEGKAVKLDILYKIDQMKLRALEGEALKALQDSNALSVAYAQIFSMPLTGMLKRLSTMKKEQKQKILKTDKIKDISSFFGEDDGDTIKFNF